MWAYNTTIISYKTLVNEQLLIYLRVIRQWWSRQDDKSLWMINHPLLSFDKMLCSNHTDAWVIERGDLHYIARHEVEGNCDRKLTAVTSCLVTDSNRTGEACGQNECFQRQFLQLTSHHFLCLCGCNGSLISERLWLYRKLVDQTHMFISLRSWCWQQAVTLHVMTSILVMVAEIAVINVYECHLYAHTYILWIHNN